MWPDLELFRARHARFHAARSRIATHAIGDRAVRETLDSWAALPSGSAGRHRTEHLETLPDATLARPGPELATASMQPVHLRWLAPDLTDPWSARLDLPRCVYAWRFGDVADSGALVVLGSDWPVAPSDPRFGFYAARTRHAHDVEPGAYGSSRPLTGEEMLAGYTRNPALAVGADAAVVAQGRPADLVIWGGDPVTVGVAELPELPVMVTCGRRPRGASHALTDGGSGPRSGLRR